MTDTYTFRRGKGGAYGARLREGRLEGRLDGRPPRFLITAANDNEGRDARARGGLISH
jgi:hypothetical protein